MLKNVAGQKVTLFAFDATTGLPKTGDAGNISAYVSLDDGAVTVLTDTSAAEADATNAKGDYLFDVSQAETNANKLRFSGKSSTANVVVVAQTFYTEEGGTRGQFQSGSTTSGVDTARTETLAAHWPGETLVITSGIMKNLSRTITVFNPTTDTLTWVPALPSAVTTETYEIWPGRTATGLMEDNVLTAAKFVSGAFDAVWSVAARIVTAATNITSTGGTTVPQTGDAFARIGAAGAGLTALGDTRVANLDAAVSTRLATAGYTVPPTVGVVADAVWDEAVAGHAGAGSTGAALSSASSAGDPWITPLPGAYGAGTAGKIIGDNVNATVGSRASQTSVDDLPTNAELATALGTADDAILAAIAALNNLSTTQVGTQISNAALATAAALTTAQAAITAIKAKTDSLTFTTAGQVDANVQAINDVTLVGNGGSTPWGP